MVFQLGSALLDACVLAVLDQGDTYGYVLTQKVKEVMDISESTLYPVLRRLQKDEALTTYDQPFSGRNRRYYQITPKGREQLDRYRAEWSRYKQSIDHILVEKEERIEQTAPPERAEAEHRTEGEELV